MMRTEPYPPRVVWGHAAPGLKFTYSEVASGAPKVLKK